MKVPYSLQFVIVPVLLSYIFILCNIDVSFAFAAPITVTPKDLINLQEAINQVQDGGTIELQTGSYTAPMGGFRINDQTKTFTIRAAAGAEVVLDGGNSTDILRFQNSARDVGRMVTFENIIFANGRTTEDEVAGAVTLYYAEAIFRNCIFENNVGQQPTTGGGAVEVAFDSSVSFYNTKWFDNTAQNEGGALSIKTNANVKIYSSEFRNNRINLPNHRAIANGGGIHMIDAELYVYDTLFEDNQAGYAGGAIYSLGNWSDSVDTPTAYTYVANSTFRNNVAARDPSVSMAVPTEGGALFSEDQSTTEVNNSLFENNRAETGGAVALYRAIVHLDGTTFNNNSVTGTGPGTGFGAAISAVSNDINDATTENGTINRRSSQLSIKNSLFTRDIALPNQAANGLYLAGDVNRTYGLGGVTQNGSVVDNRAKATITHTIFHNTDVQATSGIPGTGVGGAILTDLGDLNLRDVLVTGADATGENSSGGAISLLNNSFAKMSQLTIANSSSETFGGALFIQGSTINLSDCSLIANEISPGTSESDASSSFGAAIFAGIDEFRNISAGGSITNCLFTNNVGLPIYDDDRTSTAVNAIQYNGNQFYTTYFNDIVYVNPLVGVKNVDELNELVVDRPTEDTEKSTIDNELLPEAPTRGLLMTTRTTTLTSNNDPYYLAYAWSGQLATFDGQTLSLHSGLKLCSILACGTESKPVSHILEVDGQTFQLTLPSIADFVEKAYLPVILR